MSAAHHKITQVFEVCKICKISREWLTEFLCDKKYIKNNFDANFDI